MDMICDIINSLDANPGPIFSKCDVETRSLHYKYTENGLYMDAINNAIRCVFTCTKS